jgi:HD superfamily phosphodiesterase
MAVHVPDQLAALGEPTAATEAVWKRAESDLLVAVGAGKGDPVVWEHSSRVACLALKTAQLPEVNGSRIDRNALVAASLFHDAGWVVQARKQEIPRSELISRPTNDAQRELGASLLEQIGRSLGEASLRTAVRAVREFGSKSTPHLEAQILAEADNLDQIGPQAVWLIMRRHAGEARGIEAILEAWHRQQEYHYWEARLRECFRFDATRRLAQQRLEAVERFMNDLRQVHRMEDAEHLATAYGQAAPAPTKTRS